MPHAPSKNSSQGFRKKSWRVRHHCRDLSACEHYCISPSYRNCLLTTISREWGNKDPFGVALKDPRRSLQPLQFCDSVIRFRDICPILKAQDVGAAVLEDSKRTERPQNQAKTFHSPKSEHLQMFKHFLIFPRSRLCTRLQPTDRN